MNKKVRHSLWPDAKVYVTALVFWSQGKSSSSLVANIWGLCWTLDSQWNWLQFGRPTKKLLVVSCMCPPNMSNPNPRHLWTWPYLIKGSLQILKKVNDLLMRSSWIQIGSKLNDQCSYKAQRRKDTKTQGERSGEEGGRYWHDASTSHGMPRVGSYHQKLEKGMEGILRASRRTNPTDALISDSRL